MTDHAAKYRGLLNRYLDPPRGTIERRDLEHELAAMEHWLVANPAPYQDDEGAWRARAKGLITADEAVRASLEMLRGERSSPSNRPPEGAGSRS